MNQISMDEATITELRAQLAAMTEDRDVWQEVAGDMRRDANRLRAERNILLAALSPMPDAVRQKLDAIAEPNER